MAKRRADSTPFDYIAGLDLPLVELRKGVQCFRIHRNIYDALWFGPDTAAPVAGRFNAPNHEYGMCYFGLSFDVAFAETLLRNPTSALLAWSDLAARSVSVGRLTRKVRLAQLHGPGLRKLRIAADTVHGPHPACRNLARALWQHPGRIDGIAYRSRFDNDGICMALFDRASDAGSIDSTAGLLDDVRRLGYIFDRYGVALDP